MVASSYTISPIAIMWFYAGSIMLHIAGNASYMLLHMIPHIMAVLKSRAFPSVNTLNIV